VKPTAEQATPLVDKEVKSLERQVAQLRAQLVNALEDSAQYEREYSRIKHEGSLLCTKYDDVCKKLREASTEYNNLCDIYDSQVRLFTEDGSFCFVLLSFFLTNTHTLADITDPERPCVEGGEPHLEAEAGGGGQGR